MTGAQDGGSDQTGPEQGSALPEKGRDSGLRVALKSRADFVRVAKGRRLYGRTMSLQVLRRPEEAGPAPRFGLTVTRKVGGAVERNRIKRRLRAALRLPDLLPHPSHDYVIVARLEALTTPFAALAADLAKLVRDSGAQRRSSRQPSRERARRDDGPAPS